MSKPGRLRGADNMTESALCPPEATNWEFIREAERGQFSLFAINQRGGAEWDQTEGKGAASLRPYVTRSGSNPKVPGFAFRVPDSEGPFAIIRGDSRFKIFPPLSPRPPVNPILVRLR